MANFLLSGFAHRLDFERQPDGNPPERVVSVKHYMFGVNVRGRVNVIMFITYMITSTVLGWISTEVTTRLITIAT